LMDFKTVLAAFLKRFEDRKIRYGLMGGFALGLWGVGRSTVDLDFLIDRGDLEKVDAVMAELGYECRFRSDNVSQYVSSLKVFGEIDYLHAYRELSLEMLERAVVKDIYGGELKIRVLRPEDLIGLKLQAIKNNPARKEADMTDILALAAVQRDALDWPRVRQYAAVLGAEGLLKELQGA
jgi:hypothetical protein